MVETAQKRLSAQAAQVLSAVREFPLLSITALSQRSLIPRAVFFRRLPELERAGLIQKDLARCYSLTHPIT